MQIQILETGKIDSVRFNCSLELDLTSYVIINSGFKYSGYNDKTDINIMHQDDFDWWKSNAERFNYISLIMEYLIENFDIWGYGSKDYDEKPSNLFKALENNIYGSYTDMDRYWTQECVNEVINENGLIIKTSDCGGIAITLS